MACIRTTRGSMKTTKMTMKTTMRMRMSAVMMMLMVGGMVEVRAQSEAREPPRLVEPQTSTVRYEKNSSRIELRCTFRGDPDPSYEWYVNRGSKAVKLDPKGSPGFNPQSGVMWIPALYTAVEGVYTCRATNSFINSADVEVKAVALSPETSIRVSFLEDWPNLELNTVAMDAREYQYYSLPCDTIKPRSAGSINYRWSRRDGDVQKVVAQDSRVFVDQQGTLHFAYIKESDIPPAPYSCGVNNVELGKTVSGVKYSFGFEFRDQSADGIPVIRRLPQQRQKRVTVLVYHELKLECFFSGYPVPTITWSYGGGTPITGDQHYQLDIHKRVLTIKSVRTVDERVYTCSASGSSDVGEHAVDVTAPPMWVRRLQDTTVPQGQHAELFCDTESMPLEPEPMKPVWFRNMVPLSDMTDENGMDFAKHELSGDGKRLTIYDVLKDRDIACYQCNVTNHVGSTRGSGCLNVIFPGV